jgi:hypothetical protein|tara:strand:- start:115 stop:234 length:120 start_codon:yes stop_codon:yes gene_type:complete
MARSYKAFKRKYNGTRTTRAKNLTIRRKKARLDKMQRFL